MSGVGNPARPLVGCELYPSAHLPLAQQKACIYQLCLTSLQERVASRPLHYLGLFFNCPCAYAVSTAGPLAPDSTGHTLVGVNEGLAPGNHGLTNIGNDSPTVTNHTPDPTASLAAARLS